MFIFYFILLLHSIIDSNQANQHSYSLSMVHKYVSTIFDIPYHVLVVYGKLYCSGSILRSKIVITTASCLAAGPSGKIFVKVGSNRVTDLGQVIPVIDSKIHEYYRYYSGIDNDIALLFLKDNIIFGNKAKKVILVSPNKEIDPRVVIAVSGWGSKNLPQKYAYMLLLTNMIVLERDDCSKIYHNKITPSNFCAKYDPYHRLSDIGGPATHRQELVGILSYGAFNENGPYVAIFTNVSYFHRLPNQDNREKDEETQQFSTSNTSKRDK